MERKQIIRVILAGLAVVVLMVGGFTVYSFVGGARAKEGIFLPGTQPGDGLIFESQERCRICHFTETGPYTDWRGTMHSFAMKDPLFLATLAIANQDIPGAGDFCIRCHAPAGWLEGRSKPPDGSGLTQEDFDQGIHCDFCHRAIDPLSEEAKIRIEQEVTDYENGMYVVSGNANIKRGPYDDSVAPHETKFSAFHRKGQFCGVCHDVTNPVNGVPIERTYSEWEQSWYADQGEAGNCQSCHMKSVPGYAAELPSKAPKVPFRNFLPRHEFAGGSYWIFDVLSLFWPGLDQEAISAKKESSLQMLRSAANLEVMAKSNGQKVVARVRIYNKTGHKLPSGFPEGRRIWINVKASDAGGRIVYESGRYDWDTAILRKDAQLKVYEGKPGIKGRGATFHFVLNDYWAKDNRIPPRGFVNQNFERVGAGVIGYKYNDGQYWDDTSYTLPKNTEVVQVALYYQTTSKEYIDFLFSQNATNDWGKKILEGWRKTGKSAPVEMAMVRVPVR